MTGKLKSKDRAIEVNVTSKNKGKILRVTQFLKNNGIQIIQAVVLGVNAIKLIKNWRTSRPSRKPFK